MTQMKLVLAWLEEAIEETPEELTDEKLHDQIYAAAEFPEIHRIPTKNTCPQMVFGGLDGVCCAQ